MMYFVLGFSLKYMMYVYFVLGKGAYIKYARRPGGRGVQLNACRLVQGGGGSRPCMRTLGHKHI